MGPSRHRRAVSADRGRWLPEELAEEAAETSPVDWAQATGQLAQERVHLHREQAGQALTLRRQAYAYLASILVAGAASDQATGDRAVDQPAHGRTLEPEMVRQVRLKLIIELCH